jgi:radical SAM superfamily enzyme YgiQ (UPF0313 family)
MKPTSERSRNSVQQPSAGESPHVYSSHLPGEVAFTFLPPLENWFPLPIGSILLTQKLLESGIPARVINNNPLTDKAPDVLFKHGSRNFYLDLTMEERQREIREVRRVFPAFFERILDRLLSGSERIFGFTVFRINADTTMEVCRLLKERRPDAVVMLGGPEIAVEPFDLRQDFADVLVYQNALSMIVPIVRTILDGKMAELETYPDIWVHPRHLPRRSTPVEKRTFNPTPLPMVDYRPYLPFMKNDSRAVVPLLLNSGCPFDCGFCANKTVYSTFQVNSIERIKEEIFSTAKYWKELHKGGDVPRLRYDFADAILNAVPRQLDDLCRVIIKSKGIINFDHQFTGSFVLDSRVTGERLSLLRNVGFSNLFFGLESAISRIRKEIKKPGSIESIFETIRLIEENDGPPIIISVLAGWPSETEDDFRQNVRFIERLISFAQIASMFVLPLIMVSGAQNPDLFKGNYGDKRGLLWRTDAPAGDPVVRGERFLRYIEHFGSILHVSSSLPLDLALEIFFPSQPRKFREIYLQRFSWFSSGNIEDIPTGKDTEVNNHQDKLSCESSLFVFVLEYEDETLQIHLEPDPDGVKHGLAQGLGLVLVYYSRPISDAFRSRLLLFGEKFEFLYKDTREAPSEEELLPLLQTAGDAVGLRVRK